MGRRGQFWPRRFWGSEYSSQLRKLIWGGDAEHQRHERTYRPQPDSDWKWARHGGHWRPDPPQRKIFPFLGRAGFCSALDGDSTIVLNQKIITQDNKNSKIFVGDNIPFTGSVISTAGHQHQTTANIEYRDIGVNLSITPMLGEGDIITLDIAEEITETVPDHNAHLNPNQNVNGIRTTKTNMATHVHVPDKHFLVLSGMIRNAKSHHKSGLPCLGGLPYIGAAFSKTRETDEKRNVIIFVRPHIINSFDDYKKVTETQEEIYQRQSDPADFESGLKLINEKLPMKENISP